MATSQIQNSHESDLCFYLRPLGSGPSAIHPKLLVRAVRFGYAYRSDPRRSAMGAPLTNRRMRLVPTQVGRPDHHRRVPEAVISWLPSRVGSVCEVDLGLAPRRTRSRSPQADLNPARACSPSSDRRDHDQKTKRSLPWRFRTNRTSGHLPSPRLDAASGPIAAEAWRSPSASALSCCSASSVVASTTRV